MADHQSLAVKSLNTSSGRRRFVFKTFSQRVEDININVFRSLDPLKSKPSDGSSFFLDALFYWRELNTAEDFISFYHEIMPSVQTLPQILLHKEKIFSELLSRLHMKAKLSLEPILMDILEEFIPFMQRLVDTLADLLKNGGDRDPEIIEHVFASWSCIIMHLQKYLVKDVVYVLKITGRIRFFPRDYIQEFMAEAVSFLLRNCSIDQLTKGIRKIMREVAKNRLSDRKIGAIALVWNVMRGTYLKIHSRAEIVLQLLMDRSNLMVCDKFSQDKERMLEIVRLLIQAYIMPCERLEYEDRTLVVNEILHLMLCLLDVLPTSVDLSSFVVLYAPAFELRDSSLLTFIKGLVQKDPSIVYSFRTHIIRSLDNLIEASPDEVVFLILTLFGQGKEQLNFSIMDNVSKDQVLKIHQFFEEALCSWTKLIKDIAGNDSQTKIEVNEPTLTTLWGSLCCCPHFQLQENNLLAMHDFIINLNQLLETNSDSIAGLSKFTWQSLLGASLESYYKVLLLDRNKLVETCDILDFAKRHKNSPHVLSAVAEILDSVFGYLRDDGRTEGVSQELDIPKALDSISTFSDNLSNSNKSIRLSTLRILSHHAVLHEMQSMPDEPPVKKLRTEAAESCNKDAQYRVIDILLSVEKVPLSVSTSRKAIILISRLQMGISSAKIHKDYLPLLLHGIIGILHNRFCNLWDPAVDCLSVLIGKYKELIWDRFVQFFGNYQSKFLSSCDQLVKLHPEYPKQNALSDYFKRFLAPDSDNTPCATVMTLLLKSLQKVPELAESRSRQLIPLFLKYLGYREGVDVSVDLFDCHNSKEKEWSIVLKEWLSLLRLFRNAQSLYQSQILKKVLINRLLDEIDPDIQLKVLDCLLNWRDEYFIPYDQHLRNLVASKNLREELTVWAVSKESQSIQEGHRDYLIPIIIRLLTPKVRKPKTDIANKHAGVHHRRAVLCFLAQLDVDELQLFFSLLLKPLFALGHGTDSSCEKFKDGLQVFDLVEFSRTIGDLSWKKIYGFLHVVKDILKAFDEIHIRPFLKLLMEIVVRILESCMLNIAGANHFNPLLVGHISSCDLKSQEKESIAHNSVRSSISIKQYKDARSVCLKIISVVLNKYDSHDFGSDFWDIFFRSVKPLIDSFKQEGSSSEKPSSLFSCFVAMSRSPTMFLLLHREESLVPNIFSILTVRTASDAIISAVLNFAWNLLNLVDDLSQQVDDSLKAILLLHIDTLVSNLSMLVQTHKEVIGKQAIWPGESQLSVFKLSVKHIRDPLTAGQLIDILLQFFRQKAKIHDDYLEGLHVIKDILPVLDDKKMGNVLNAIRPLLTHVDLDLRLLICDILDGLMMNDPSLTFLAKLLRRLNAVSASSLEIGEPDYDTRVEAYGSIKPELFSVLKDDHALIILSQCVYDMSSEELVFRQSASRALLSFVQFAGPIVNSEKKYCDEIISKFEPQGDKVNTTQRSSDTSVTWTKVSIQKIIKNIFLSNMGEAMKKDISVQKEWVILLRDMVYNFNGEPALNSLRPLYCEDVETDFFNNILHLQIHRRIKALAHFRNVISVGNISENVTVKIFVPLVLNMLFYVKDGKGEHLRNACVETLASISSRMQWDSYRTLLMRCFREIKFKPDKQKILLRLMSAILDMFHFSEPNSGHEVVDGDSAASISCSISGNSKIASTTSYSGLRIPCHIQNYLHETVLPKIQKLLTSDSEKVNVNISLAVLKLLKLLPVDTMDSQLPSVIHRISNFLKNRLESIRDEARHALTACLKELGMEYLQFIVKVLQATLKRGYELHVLGYTLNFILSNTLTVPVAGTLDYCLEELLCIVENDVLGDVAEEKEVDKIASKMKETRKSRSFDTLKLIGQRITFRTHALKLLLPLSKYLEKHIKPKTKAKLEMMLQHVASGIECNPSVQLEELFIFVYGLIEDNIHEDDSKVDKASVVKSFNHGLAKSHLFIVFALGLLHNRLNNMKLDKKDEHLLTLLDPFVKLLGECLNSKYEDVLSASFRCLAPLVRLPLPSLEAEATKIKILLLDIAQTSGNPGSTLVQSCLKLLTVLLHSGRISLSDDQLHSLVQFPLFVDLQTNPSPVALSLLKSIIGRKLVVHEIYDLVMRVGELMVTNQSESIRKKCSQILLQFLLDYHLSDKRLQQHMDFLLTNLSYEHCSGREAVLEMLHTVLVKFPRSVLDAQAHAFFLHLVVALANEHDDKIRSMIATVIKELLSRTSRHALDPILAYSLSWYTSEKQHLWSAAAQVLGLLVDVLKKGFQKHINIILDVTRNILEHSVDASGETYDASNNLIMPFWKEAYHSLIMLEKMLLNIPRLAFEKDLEDIWEMICKLLLHPHVSLRNISSRLVALYFSVISEGGIGDNDRLKFETLSLLNPGNLFAITVSFLNQLRMPLTDDSTSHIVTQNLVFSVCGLHAFTRKSNNVFLHELWSTLDPHEQDSYLRAFESLGSKKARSVFLQATSSKVSAKLNQSEQESKGDLQALLVLPLLKRMGKIALETDNAQMTVIFNSFKTIASQIGSEGCQEYAVYLLLPLYKVCEGFAGKVIGDEVKQLAEEVRNSIRNELGVDNFVRTYNEIRKMLSMKRDKRRQKWRVAAVADPVRYAKRKLRIADKHRAHKKRKIELMKFGRWRR
ncbi:LOW QUALITY PROTEIN: small subunit processome component 20 homolog [Dioscorea cayenensis subsp. rotundata]|uniref:LOW QUALITY PROTEIN: small subunit processome component 20 homolog n=1 Tax=Dioscorea cayennensis subsp. rotundata TaxID=55577 RepID=A0AB40BW27_DIOCR|nr:LOW QUALITY PROTEIN: small subunit processome component 20 homolog [Dioscorea cayenensis subsp. rotundata]